MFSVEEEERQLGQPVDAGQRGGGDKAGRNALLLVSSVVR